MKTSIILVVAALASCGAAPAQIVTFSFNGASGNETSFAPDAQPAFSLVSHMTRGLGLTPSANAETFSASSWTTGSQPDTSDYFSFSIIPLEGYSMSLTSLSLDERRSLTGIRSWVVRSNLDGFSQNLSLFSVPDDSLTRTRQTTLLENAFENLMSSVEFRIFGYAAESGAGTWRIDNVQLHGSFSAVPEPHEYAMLAGVGLLGFAIYRRWRNPSPAGELSS